MNWFTENKIFSSVLVLLALAILGLAYLTFAERGKYAEALEGYQAGVTKLSSMRGMAPYRNQENLKKIEGQVRGYKELTDDLHNELLKRQGTIASIEPAIFQGRLREIVSKTIERANQQGVELPPKFYLGFEKYENELPRNDIAGLLNWQLSAIEAVVERLIDLKVTKLEKLVRPELPGESTPEPALKEMPLFKKYPIEVVFSAYPGSVQSILNELDKMPQFLIARTVRIVNEQLKAPARVAPGAAVVDPAVPAEPAVDRIIIGKERVSADLIIDLVQFTQAQVAKK